MLEFLDNKRSVIYASNILYLAAVKFLFHLKTYNVILPVVMKNPLFRMQKKVLKIVIPLFII